MQERNEGDWHDTLGDADRASKANSRGPSRDMQRIASATAAVAQQHQPILTRQEPENLHYGLA